MSDDSGGHRETFSVDVDGYVRGEMLSVADRTAAMWFDCAPSEVQAVAFRTVVARSEAGSQWADVRVSYERRSSE